MFECSLCSFVGMLCRCLANMMLYALDYPLITFLLSLCIATIFVANVHSARLICDFSSPRSGSQRLSRPRISKSSNINFDYGPDRGPHTWQCSVENQSPVNITDGEARRLPIRELLTWNHYDDLPTAIILENDGHTVILRAAFNGNTPTLSGADLLASYTFVELRFRWSQWNNEGSEHMLNNRKFPLELQALHRTGPITEECSSYDILMVAYFYELSTNNPFLEPLVQNLYRIQKPGSSVEIPPFPLSYVCHQFRTNFYSYGGSLTEPPCYQGAEWFVFPEPLAISERQLNEFRMLLCRDGKSRILTNARPVQNLDISRVINLNHYNPLLASAGDVCDNGPINQTFTINSDEC